MEDQEKKGNNVVIEVKSKATESNVNEEVKAQEEFKSTNDTIETINADELSAEELENLSDDSKLDSNPEGLAGEAMSLFGKFKEYVGSDRFDQVCAGAAERNGVDKSVIQNAFIKNALGTIANALNLSVSIAGDIIKGAVSFIETIISTVVSFSTSTLHKLVTALTLNCGTLQF